MGPTQLSTQCVDYLLVWKGLGETHHVEEVRPAKPVSKLNGQLSTQRVDYFFAVIGALFLEDVRPNSLPDLPIKQNQRRIHRLGDTLAGVTDQSAQIVEQLRPGNRRRSFGRSLFGPCDWLYLLRHAAKSTGSAVFTPVSVLNGLNQSSRFLYS